MWYQVILLTGICRGLTNSHSYMSLPILLISDIPILSIKKHNKGNFDFTILIRYMIPNLKAIVVCSYCINFGMR